MRLDECVGKEVEITILGLQRDEVRTTGVIVYGEADNGEGTIHYLRHTLTEQEWEWNGIHPIDAEEGYRYWGLDFQQELTVWYKDMKVIGSITPKMYVKEHKMIWN